MGSLPLVMYCACQVWRTATKGVALPLGSLISDSSARSRSIERLPTVIVLALARSVVGNLNWRKPDQLLLQRGLLGKLALLLLVLHLVDASAQAQPFNKGRAGIGKCVVDRSHQKYCPMSWLPYAAPVPNPAEPAGVWL
mgnify:CR=1 FL=1